MLIVDCIKSCIFLVNECCFHSLSRTHQSSSLLSSGLFECNYFDYARECIRYLFLASLAFYFFYGANQSWHYYLSAVFLGAFWHQLTFTAHDAGHLAITHSYRIDSLIGILIANVLGGISIGWWKHHHNIHHIVTNAPEHDPGKRSFAVCKSSGFTISLSCSIPFHYPDELE